MTNHRPLSLFDFQARVFSAFIKGIDKKYDSFASTWASLIPRARI